MIAAKQAVKDSAGPNLATTAEAMQMYRPFPVRWIWSGCE